MAILGVTFRIIHVYRATDCTGLQSFDFRAVWFGLQSSHSSTHTHTHTRTHTSRAELSQMPCELKCYLAFYPKKLSRKGDRVLASAFRFVPDLVAFLKMSRIGLLFEIDCVETRFGEVGHDGLHRRLSASSGDKAGVAPSLRGLPNFLVYRIKRVHFDMIMKPSSIFFYRHRECCTEIAYVKMTHAEYLSQFYRTIVTLEHQPLLEAYPEKASECVFLLPEFCYPASVTEGMRRDAGVLRETLQQIEASPQERHNAILRQVRRIESACSETLDSWGCRLHSPVKTMEVIARPPAGGRKLCPQLQVWRSVSCNGQATARAFLLFLFAILDLGHQADPRHGSFFNLTRTSPLCSRRRIDPAGARLGRRSTCTLCQALAVLHRLPTARDCRRGSPADRPLSSPNALATVTATRSNSVRWLRALATLLGCGEACLPSVVTSAAPLPQRLALRAACRCDVRHGAACEMQPPHSSPKTSSEECNVEGQ
eukprot:s549_g8.t3